MGKWGLISLMCSVELIKFLIILLIIKCETSIQKQCEECADIARGRY
jgi:hypothetical protein